jgi:DNA primase
MMIDTSYIKDRTDCRNVIERDLGRPRYRSNRYHLYKCPLHREQKGYSLAVYADHWQCFGKCDRGGDVIAWLRAYHDLTFKEACQRLGANDLPPVKSESRPRPPKPPSQSQLPEENWRKAADTVANQAMDTLWGAEGRRAWAYLEARGLSEKTIVNAGLGYVPGRPDEWREIAGLNVPCGITIPWYADRKIWGIKVRRAAGKQRYQQVAGGNLSGSLYLADTLQPGLPVLLTEGEFDALIAQQAGDGLIHAAAIGSASNKRVNPRWYPKFIAAPRILICMDADQAGEGAAAQLSQLSRAARCVQVPQGKDINEFYQHAGHQAVHDWIHQISEVNRGEDKVLGYD